MIGCQNRKLASGFLGPQGDPQVGPWVPFPLLRVQGAVSAAGPALGFIQEISRHVHRGPGLTRHQRHRQGPGPGSTSAASNKHLLVPAVYGPRASRLEQSRAGVRVTPGNPALRGAGARGCDPERTCGEDAPQIPPRPRLYLCQDLFLCASHHVEP